MSAFVDEGCRCGRRAEMEVKSTDVDERRRCGCQPGGSALRGLARLGLERGERGLEGS